MPKLQRVLVANRGEIAVRVIRACQALDIETVLVVSAGDRDTMGAQLATRTVCIGPPPSSASYLDVKLIVQAAISTQCDAIHPGYGFLSEKYELAKMCEDNDLIFVGPSSDSIRNVGDKLNARAIAIAAGVPVVPGSELVKTAEDAANIATTIGYPVMLKAAAGGGGRGVFVANSAEEILASFERASAEAQASFGDGSLYMERFIGNARHIEVQVLGDKHGHAIHLGERDCSIQRRYQKVVEEGPAAVLDSDIAAKLYEAALRIARHLNYVNAGTVEFLYDADRQEFFFMEMNARVQVEHPVSELITGVDIVQAQLRIAAGERLSIQQKSVKIEGHAIECRINAESPRHNFMPRPGRITKWEAPNMPGVRLDSHCYSGYLVPPFYDSMIGKLLVHAADRPTAIKLMLAALDNFRIEGIETNLDFHKALLQHPDYGAGAVNTRWLERIFLPAYQAEAAGSIHHDTNCGIGVESTPRS